MTLFKLVADAEFHADDIEDALLALGGYFSNLADDANADTIFTGGSIEVVKVDDDQGNK